MIKTIAGLLLAGLLPAQNIVVTTDPGVLPFWGGNTLWHEFVVEESCPGSSHLVIRGRVTTGNQDLYDGFSVFGVQRMAPLPIVPWLEVEPIAAVYIWTNLQNYWPTPFNEVCWLPRTLPPCSFLVQTVLFTPWWEPWCNHPLETNCLDAWTPVLTVRAW